MPAQSPMAPTQGAETTLSSGMAKQPGSTRNTDSKKSEKVKDFYSNLLNKKKDKNRASAAGGKQPPTPSNTEQIQSTIPEES